MSGRQGEILVLDDDKAHRSLIRRSLEKSGISQRLVEVGSLSEALSYLFDARGAAKAQPLLALIDLNLGNERGTSLVKRLRNSPEHDSVVVIVLSTSGLDDDIRECYELGANCYMIKAADPAIFRREISSAVRFWLSFRGSE